MFRTTGIKHSIACGAGVIAVILASVPAANAVAAATTYAIGITNYCTSGSSSCLATVRAWGSGDTRGAVYIISALAQRPGVCYHWNNYDVTNYTYAGYQQADLYMNSYSTCNSAYWRVAYVAQSGG